MGRIICCTTVGLVLLTGCETLPLPMPMTQNSGIDGTVLVGPQCPGGLTGPNCANRPLAADVIVRDPGTGAPVAAFRSGSDGRFSVALAPGDYQLDPQPDPSGIPFGHPQSVQVQPNQYTHTVILYDSGIR